MSISISKNTYTLTVGDDAWICDHLDLPPIDFIRGLLRQRFTGSSRRFRSLHSLADAAYAFIKENDWSFSQRDIDRSAREHFLAMRERSSRQMLEEFLLLWRGYTATDVMKAKTTLREDRAGWLKDVERAIAKNNHLKRRAIEKGRVNRAHELAMNEKELEQIRQLIIRTADRDPDLLARQKVSFAVLYRRKAALRFFYSSPHDYLGVETALEEKNPFGVSFPLRFMSRFIVVGEYLRLRRKWAGGSPRGEIFLDLVKGDPSEGSGMQERLLELNRKILSHFHQDRSGPIQEIEKCYRQKCFLAVALVGITQAEGVIWDFASYLNGRNIRVFKRSGKDGRTYHPYPWDRTLSRYRRSNHPRWDSSGRLTSARAVLQQTRVGSIISPELYSYFVDEFYDDRNNLAHGRIGARNIEADAIAAILAFYACLHEVARYLGEVRDGGNT